MHRKFQKSLISYRFDKFVVIHTSSAWEWAQERSWWSINHFDDMKFGLCFDCQCTLKNNTLLLMKAYTKVVPKLKFEENPDSNLIFK